MGYLKSLFVSVLLTASIAGVFYSLVRCFAEGWNSPWIGTLIASGAFAAFIASAYLWPRARTSRNLIGMLVAGVIGTAIAAWLEHPTGPAAIVAAAIGIAGNFAYVFWYSRFTSPETVLQAGATLPALKFVENGHEVSSERLTRRAALWVFYRGNWCPLCVAQVREIAAQYGELARRGVDVFLVSPQSQQNTEALAKRFEVPMRFLIDVDNRAAATLGILVRGGLPAGFQALGFGSDVPRPTVFVTAAGGQILWRDLTDNYRVRPEPATIFHVLDQHAI